VIPFLREIVLMLLVGGGAALLVRFVLPVALQVATFLLVEILSVLAAIALLPDVIVAAPARRRSSAPPRWVYEYGDAVGTAARVVRLALRQVSRGLSRLARKMPLGLVAAVAAAIQLLSVLS
jgi:hypothetical protein